MEFDFDSMFKPEGNYFDWNNQEINTVILVNGTVSQTKVKGKMVPNFKGTRYFPDGTEESIEFLLHQQMKTQIDNRILKKEFKGKVLSDLVLKITYLGKQSSLNYSGREYLSFVVRAFPFDEWYNQLMQHLCPN